MKQCNCQADEQFLILDEERWPTRESAMAAQRADFHREDARRALRRDALERWDRAYAEQRALHPPQHLGDGVLVQPAPLVTHAVVSKHVAAWLTRNPRP